MYRKKLVTCITRALIAGGLLFSFSSSALANSSYNPWENGGASAFNYGQYRFRPVTPHQNVRYSYSTGRYQQPQWKPAYSSRNGYNPSHQYRYSPYQGMRFRQPAFARQYGWSPASKMVVRRVSESSHYASSGNSYVEEVSTAPVYHSAPISSQGFRYRDMKRNAPYVTFSDRVKQVMKMDEHFTPMTAPQHVQIQLSRSRQHQPVLVRQQQNQKITGHYKFRPDERFGSQLPQPAVVTQPVPKQSDFKLVDVKVNQPGENFLDNWSFRPVESTF